MKLVSYHWDEMKIGPGAPPFKTGKGWLHIYHGVFKTMSGTVYRLGAALHDLDDPANIIPKTAPFFSNLIDGFDLFWARLNFGMHIIVS